MPTDIDDDMSEDKHEALPFPESISSEMKLTVLMMMHTNRMLRPQNIDAFIIAEQPREEGLKETSRQKTTVASSPSYDNETTIVATSPNEDAKSDFMSESNSFLSTSSQATSASYESKNNSSKIWGYLILYVFGLIILGALITILFST